MTPLAQLVAELRALAEKATHGKWTAQHVPMAASIGEQVHLVRRNDESAGLQGNIARTYSTLPHDADFIAAVSPDVILRLCAALESEYARGVEDAARVADDERQSNYVQMNAWQQSGDERGEMVAHARGLTAKDIGDRIRALVAGKGE